MEEKLFAGFWVRFFAGLLDFLFLMPFFIILIYFFGIDDYAIMKINNDYFNYSTFSAVGHDNRIVNILYHIIYIAYLSYFVAGKKQATLGKRLMGIYVANRDGSKLTCQKSLARALASILTSMTLGLGFLIVAFTKEKTALHDIICNTRVFYGKKS